MLSGSVSSSMFPRLFEPGRIGALSLKNRLIKAPTVTGLATRDGCVTDRMAAFYREMARGGVGLVIVENSHVDMKASKSIACQLSSSHDEHKSGLKWLATTIRSNGARACLQLGHGGRQKMIPLLPIKAPSRVPSEDRKRAGLPLPEELTLDEIAEIVEAFGSAAERAKHAGFDMVEILGCHGYLITNFLSPLANRRSDRYGGDIENRMRFLLEVIHCVKRKTGGDFPLSVRLNGSDYEQGSITFEETKTVALALEKAGVSALHVTGGTFDSGHMEIVPMYVPAAPHVWAAEGIKRVVSDSCDSFRVRDHAPACREDTGGGQSGFCISRSTAPGGPGLPAQGPGRAARRYPSLHSVRGRLHDKRRREWIHQLQRERGPGRRRGLGGESCC